MHKDEVLETTRIFSVAGLIKESEALVKTRPFRSPHHTSSSAALVGGGSIPKPGEITLAHRGVLFLDEFPEFDRPVLESLRQPLEDGTVTVSRVRGSLTFPAKFILAATMNPCPAVFLTIRLRTACARLIKFKNTAANFPGHCWIGLIFMWRCPELNMKNWLQPF